MEQPPRPPEPQARGHRSVPHTADLRIEAWAATREECVAEAVRGLVESFADVRPARAGHEAPGEPGGPGELGPPGGPGAPERPGGPAGGGGRVVRRRLTGESDADLLVAAIEEVIYSLDADGEIPVGVAVSAAGGGGIDLTLALTSVDSVEITGAGPKAATLSGLRCGQEAPGRWSCAITIDV